MRLHMLDAEANRVALAEIAQTAVDAFAHCRDSQEPGIYGDLAVGTHAKQVFDIFGQMVQRRFLDHPHIKVHRADQLTFVGLGDVNIRLRKTNHHGLRIARNSTKNFHIWTTASPATLPDFDHMTLQHVLAYSPDPIWMQIPRMALGLYRDDMPISYREIDLSMLNTDGVSRWDPSSQDQAPSALPPLEFTDSVDSPRLNEEMS